MTSLQQFSLGRVLPSRERGCPARLKSAQDDSAGEIVSVPPLTKEGTHKLPWQSQGKKEQARQRLTNIYGWFTEGLDTKDLRVAKTLLEELSG